MREANRDKGRIEHMLTAIDNVLLYTKDMTLEQLKEDNLRKHATTYNVQIIGEAVYMLTKEFRATHPDTPWRQIEKMRHILVHDYYQIDIDILWAVITEDGEYSGKTKEGKWFKWNPPTLPSWALPSNSSSKVDKKEQAKKYNSDYKRLYKNKIYRYTSFIYRI